MAKNYKFSGKRVTLATASAARRSGALAREQGFVGIPINTVITGASIVMALEGVWGMTYAGYGEEQPAIGTILYWDTTTDALSIGADNDDYPAVKCVTAVSASNGAFNGLLLPQGNPYGQEQS